MRSVKKHTILKETWVPRSTDALVGLGNTLEVVLPSATALGACVARSVWKEHLAWKRRRDCLPSLS